MAAPGSTAPEQPTAIFGGTFDPVHFGHLRAALEVRELLGLDEVRMLPAGEPPHRPPTVASAVQRLEMLRLATASSCGLAVDDREVRRAGPSFMVDTLAEIRSAIGDAPLLLLIGQDAANALDSWHQWEQLFELAHLVVMRRPDAHFACVGKLRQHIERRRTDDPMQLRMSAAGAVLAVRITQLEISSTVIRRLIAEGRTPRFLLPDAVIEYIDEQRLYSAA